MPLLTPDGAEETAGGWGEAENFRGRAKAGEEDQGAAGNRVIPLKFREMLPASWNLVNYCKITQFLIKFCKSLKDLRKILLEGLKKQSNIALIL